MSKLYSVAPVDWKDGKYSGSSFTAEHGDYSLHVYFREGHSWEWSWNSSSGSNTGTSMSEDVAKKQCRASMIMDIRIKGCLIPFSPDVEIESLKEAERALLFVNSKKSRDSAVVIRKIIKKMNGYD